MRKEIIRDYKYRTDDEYCKYPSFDDFVMYQRFCKTFYREDKKINMSYFYVWIHHLSFIIIHQRYKKLDPQMYSNVCSIVTIFGGSYETQE